MSENVPPKADILSEPRPPIYRAIMLTGSGSVLNVMRLSAKDDEQAIAFAKMMVDGHAVELWHGQRFIDHFAPIE